MYLIACGALAALSALLNFRDVRLLSLTFFITVSIFVPVPSATAEMFYTFCLVFEIAIALAALSIDSDRAGEWIATICALLVIAHVLGYYLNGSSPFSPYHVIVKTLELAQLVVCVALSPLAAPILRNRDATST